MGILQACPIDFYPPLAIKLRSGIVLANPSAQWHFDLLVQAGIPEDQWAEVVAESGFVDPQGTFVAGHGARVLEGKHYFARPSEEGQPWVIRGHQGSASPRRANDPGVRSWECAVRSLSQNNSQYSTRYGSIFSYSHLYSTPYPRVPKTQ